MIEYYWNNWIQQPAKSKTKVRLRTPVPEAFSYGMRHVFILIQWTMTKSGSNQLCHHTASTALKQNMAYVILHFKWINIRLLVVNHFKSAIKVRCERKRSSTDHTKFIWLKLWTKEKNGVHKVTIILMSRHTCHVAIHFCMQSSGVWN